LGLESSTGSQSPVCNPDEDSVVSSDLLLDQWNAYRDRISKKYVPNMGGVTPMSRAFERAEQIMTKELQTGAYESDSLLFVVSDGFPTDDDSKASKIRARCERLKQLGITILSCYISDEDVTMPRELYEDPAENWSNGARLMFDCASILQVNSVFWQHLKEFHWEAPSNSRLFAQINQSEVLTEFVNVLLGPIEQTAEPMAENRNKSLVFVSYSHADGKYVKNKAGTLLYYLRGLEHEGVNLWWDEQIPPGAQWDTVVREKLGEAGVVLALVSQAFLDSDYCIKVEIPTFIKDQKEKWLTVIPVILSACEWQRQDWLSGTQSLPRNGKNVETDYNTPGLRKGLYLDIRKSIRSALVI
jgi:hypothetical protein